MIKEIIESEVMQRLARINQNGAAAFVYPRLNTTRLEHSIGVMLLLKRFGASREEQVAGLIHDISHTAFSHVIDFVFDEHGYHEKMQEEVIMDSSLPKIFAKHGFSVSDFIIEKNKFQLLENDVPGLCCDRLDYFLRDWKAFYGKDKTGYLQWIKKENGELYFTNKIEAKKCVQDFIAIDKGLWGCSPVNNIVYRIFADALRIALDNDIITKYEIEKSDDNKILEKLKKSSNLKLAVLIEKLKPGFSAELNEKEFDYHLPAFPRWIDPKVHDGKALRNISEIDRSVKKIIDEHLSSMDKGLYIKIIS
jgi:HD superfamily phosphohydrolase